MVKIEINDIEETVKCIKGRIGTPGRIVSRKLIKKLLEEIQGKNEMTQDQMLKFLDRIKDMESEFQNNDYRQIENMKGVFGHPLMNGIIIAYILSLKRDIV